MACHAAGIAGAPKTGDKAAWKPRDSQGELVYRDQMWIFGGWFQSFEAPPRDVWSSADGKTWERRPNTNAPPTTAFGAGVFVGANWKGRLFHSTDAVSWREVHKCDEHIEAVAFGVS